MQFSSGTSIHTMRMSSRLVVYAAAVILTLGSTGLGSDPAVPVRSDGPHATAASDVQSKPVVPGSTFRDCDQCPEMAVVPAGVFVMGKINDKTGRLGPRHEVRIEKPFAIARFEVTFAQWETCVADKGCGGHRVWESIRIYGRKDDVKLRSRAPVVNIRWREARAYVGWLSRTTGRDYRLPSEAEWEYAARAGTTTQWFCGSDPSCLNEVAWYAANSSNETHPVGSKRANAFGLHDVHGNVWEWVEDCWHPNYRGAPSDGSAWTAGGDCSKPPIISRHVIRGGSWGSTAWMLRIANRFVQRRTTLNVGFRVARNLDQ